MMIARMGDVAHHYAPPAPGSYTDKHLYFTLNPGRADRKVGSFCIHISGPKAGHWCDFATDPKGGDVFDLIGLALGLPDIKDQLREARSFLGLHTSSPEERRQQEVAMATMRARRAAEAEAQLREAQRKQRQAEGMWLGAEEQIKGTPVDAYLRGRGIDLASIGHQPRALRYLAQCQFHWQDRDTGEVIQFKAPAMVAAMTNLMGKTVAVHRTYLGLGPNGTWGKLRIPHPSNPGELLPVKKVFGWENGCCIRLSNGIGPEGGKGVALNRCPPGTRVYIAEGIETALSARVLKPDARVLAAYSLSNMGMVALPDNVAEVVLIADADENDQAQAALQKAIDAHAAKGRDVRVWRSDRPGEDLNDVLQRRLREQEEQGAA